MGYLALLADESTSAAAQAPWWVSGASGLLGTIVGGVITFFTTRSTNTKTEEATQERHRKDQITDIATRYIQAVSKQSVESMKLEETMAEFQKMLKDAQDSGDPIAALRVLETATNFDPDSITKAMQNVESQLNMASGLLQGMAGSGSSLSELHMLVAEMRLVLPNKVVQTAELVSSVTVGLASLSQALPLAVRLQLGGVLNNSLNVFVNEVRREVGLPNYGPEKLDLHGAAKRLEQMAEEQKQADY
jgi:hypothetical protein